MHFYVTTLDVYCDDHVPEYNTKFFTTREDFEAHVATLESDEVHSVGELTQEQQDYYSQLLPF